MTLKLPRFLVDLMLRRKAAFHRTPLDRYQVRVARTAREYEDAFRLVQLSYVYQGIARVDENELRITKQHLLPEATVLVAYEGDNLVGTMTVTLDSAAALPLDKDYPRELNALRQSGARLVEYGSLAVIERCWHTGVTDLMNILAYSLATGPLCASHVVIGVHPRVTDFYRAVYDFAPLAGARHHATLAAPVAGMVQDLSRFRSFLQRHFRAPMQSGHRPVEHFFGRPLSGTATLPLHLDIDALARWKMPSEVFQEVFVRRRSRASLSLRVVNGGLS